MQVFISWSGEQSKALGACFRDWLPCVLQAAKPWFSPEDIDKGARWLIDLSNQLESQSVAIVCVTPESACAPWLLFEVGALSKALDHSRVCPVLLGLEPKDLSGPLSQFQATRTTKDDVLRLLTTINQRLDAPLPTKALDTVYDALWPMLEEKLKTVRTMPSAAQVRTRHTTELLSEILERLQSVERHVSDLYSSNETERRKQAANRRFFEIKKQVEGISQEIKDLSQAKRDTVHALNAIPDTDSTERSALLAHLAMIEGKAKQLWDLGDGLQAETVGIANALGLKVPGPSAPATPLTSSTT